MKQTIDLKALLEKKMDALEPVEAAQTAIERFTVDDADTPAFNQALARLCAAQTAVDVAWAETIGR